MKVKVVVHGAEEDGFWAEVPAIPGKTLCRMAERNGWVLRRVRGTIIPMGNQALRSGYRFPCMATSRWREASCAICSNGRDCGR